MEKKVLLIGNLKNENSPSMHLYLEDLKKIKGVDLIQPFSKIPKSIFKLFIYPFKIPRNYSVYHIVDHSYSFLINFLPKEKTIITCHDLIPLKFKKNMSLKARLMFKIYLKGIKKAKKIIVISESTKKDLMSLLNIPERKIVVIPIPCDLSKFKKLEKYKENNLLKDKSPLILSVGSSFYKNTLLILKSIKRLRKNYPKILLLKVGLFSKEERSYIKENSLFEFVMEFENVDQKKLNDLYNFSDILVFPSLYEGFGKPPLEAMKCGLPVITSNVSSLPEVVRNSAIKINPYSEKELSNSIKKIMVNGNFKNSLIEKGYKNVKRFSLNKILKQTEKIYKPFLV